VAHTCIREAEIRRIAVKGQPRQIALEALSQKYPIQNRAGRVAHVVEHPPSKCKTLSSNSSITEKKV
jgi:hypothetical protein